MRTVIRVAQPQWLIGAALFYALGGGIAHYLGAEMDWGLYWLGQGWLAVTQLGAHLLYAAYRQPEEQAQDREARIPGVNSLLLAGAACLAVSASLSVLMLQATHFAGEIVVALLLLFLGAVFYAAPPLHLVDSGYGEMMTAALIANLTPALAFWLQSGEDLRLVAMSTFPLMPLLLAMQVALRLPHYAADQKRQRSNLLVRLGWQNGMLLHNLLILTGFLLLAAAVVSGLPLGVAWPALCVLPVGLLQIWSIQRILNGAKPHWESFRLAAAALVGAVVYLLAFAFWMS